MPQKMMRPVSTGLLTNTNTTLIQWNLKSGRSLQRGYWRRLVHTFVFRGELTDSQPIFDIGSMLLLVSTLAQIGMFTLWILDHIVYHGLLNAVFTAALHIESTNPRLPPVRSIMMRISGGSGMSVYSCLFYLIPMLVLSVIGWTGVFLAFDYPQSKTWIWVVVAAITSALPIWVILKTRSIASASSYSRPPSATDQPLSYEAVIARWLLTLRK